MQTTRKMFLMALGVALIAVTPAAADVPAPCAPVPVRKAVKMVRREIAVSIIGKNLLARPKGGTRSAEEMIAYWTAAMDEEIGNKPDLVVLPEISDVIQGVSPQEEADWLRRRGNRVLEAFAAYAKRHRCYLVYPTYRQRPDGTLANCAIVIDRDGDVVGVYDKYQPTVRDLGNPAMDVRPGTGPCVVETDFGRLGVMICFDLNFQPIQDLYARENVDVLAFPSYYDGGHNRHTWAARCQAYVVAATVGSLDKTVVGPAGDELFRAVSPVTTATVRINTNCRVVHLDFNGAKLAAAKKKYGSRLAYRYEGRTGVVTVLSTDPALPVDDVLAEFEIENWRDYAARSAAAREAKLAVRVPPPWTPVEAKDGVISVWGREYAFASNALPVGVKTSGREMLAGPMRIVCADEKGNEIAWKKGGSWVQEADAESATVCAWQEADEVAADVTARIEFDGMAKVSLALVPGPKRHRMNLSRAWLEIPFAPERATLFNYSPASWSKLENTGAVKGPLAWPFRCAVWLGDEETGLCWFCESDEAFSPADPERTIEVLPGTDATVLRIRLAEVALTQPTTWVFGLQATPVKPFPKSFTANHTVHAPQMGAGITIKRPEVWWTAQRAFPEGKIDETLDAVAKAGTKTVVFHEDWIPIQNNPAPRADFKAIVDKCHARGMKVLVYQGYELSPLDPAWGDHHADWLAKDVNGHFVSYWFREPGQRDYRICYRNGSADLWLARVKGAYDALGLDGLYLDGTIMPRACANERHGCGWRDAEGKLHATYPFFAVRRMMRELYEFVEARGGRIDAHQSGYVCPATLAFAHSYWDGEQIAVGGNRKDIHKELNIDAFRAEFMGRNHGVPCEFLAYEKPGWSYDDALAITLLHDVMVRPCGFVGVPRLAPVWKAFDDFGAAEAEWTPYWKNPVAASPGCVKASVYRKGSESLIVVSNVSADEEVTAEVSLPPGATHATDALSGKELPVRDGRVCMGLVPFRYILILAR